MDARVAVTPEVQSLIEAACDGVADDVQLRNLKQFLLTDEAARTLYVDLLNLDAELNWLVGSQHTGDAAVAEFVAVKQTSQDSAAPAFPALALRPRHAARCRLPTAGGCLRVRLRRLGRTHRIRRRWIQRNCIRRCRKRLPSRRVGRRRIDALTGCRGLRSLLSGRKCLSLV